jgi:hypothetical protein
MGNPYWLNLMNAGLGLAVLVCTGAVGIGIWQELAMRRKAAAAKNETPALDALGSHAFDLPELGLTMADGGEEIKKKEDGR